MAIFLPNASDANNDSANAISADVAAAQAVFIASATVLINNATQNGFFKVEPFMIPFVSPSFVISYFTALGYNVLFPIIPPGPWNPCFAPAGFPEVIPSNWTNWSCGCNQGCGPLRIRISWGPPAESFLLLENGFLFLLEDGVDGILLEQSLVITP